MKKVLAGIMLCIFFACRLHAAGAGFQNITPQQLKAMLSGKKDFVLIDVHVPEQKHIQGTDDFIPYNAISQNVDKLPSKDEKIVLYCRTDNMSTQATRELSGMGYKHIYNLQGGTEAWKKAGFDVDGPDRIIYLTAQRFFFTPDTIRVKNGDKVKIIARSKDVTHGFGLPVFGVNERIEPGRRNIIEFTADKKGDYTFHCTVYCGIGHSRMKGEFIVE